MGERFVSDEDLGSTGFSYTLSVIPILDGMCERGDNNRLARRCARRFAEYPRPATTCCLLAAPPSRTMGEKNPSERNFR